MIKINLIREGRAAVRGATGAPGPAAAAGPSNINNLLIVGLLVVGLVLSGGYWFIKHREEVAKKQQIAEQQAEADKLQKIIQEVENFQKRKDSLQKRIDLINQLKQNQKGPVRIMDRISQDLPDLVWLDKMTLDGTHITLDGRALNPNAFANYIDAIKADPMFDEPEVNGVTEQPAGKGPSVYSWGMSFNFKGTPAEAAPAGGAEGAAATTGTTPPAAAAPGM